MQKRDEAIKISYLVSFYDRQNNFNQNSEEKNCLFAVFVLPTAFNPNVLIGWLIKYFIFVCVDWLSLINWCDHIWNYWTIIEREDPENMLSWINLNYKSMQQFSSMKRSDNDKLDVDWAEQSIWYVHFGVPQNNWSFHNSYLSSRNSEIGCGGNVRIFLSTIRLFESWAQNQYKDRFCCRYEVWMIPKSDWSRLLLVQGGRPSWWSKVSEQLRFWTIFGI